MVPSLSIFLIVVTLLLAVLAPVVFLIILMRGRKGVFSAWILGALGFIVPQILIRIPLLQYIGTKPWYANLAQSQFVLFTLLLALTAGLFETTGRFFVFRFALRKRLSFVTGLAAGAGHGAAESIGLIGLTYINNLVLSLMINAGMLESLIPDAAAANRVITALTGTPSNLFLAAGVERLIAMALHAALSTLLCYLIWQGRSFAGFILVMMIHTAVDFSVVIFQSRGFSGWTVEGAMVPIAILSVILIVWLKKRWLNRAI